MKTRRGRILHLTTAAASIVAFSGLALFAASESAWPLAAGAMLINLADAIRLGGLVVEWTEPK